MITGILGINSDEVTQASYAGAYASVSNDTGKEGEKEFNTGDPCADVVDAWNWMIGKGAKSISFSSSFDTFLAIGDGYRFSEEHLLIPNKPILTPTNVSAERIELCVNALAGLDEAQIEMLLMAAYNGLAQVSFAVAAGIANEGDRALLTGLLGWLDAHHPIEAGSARAALATIHTPEPEEPPARTLETAGVGWMVTPIPGARFTADDNYRLAIGDVFTVEAWDAKAGLADLRDEHGLLWAGVFGAALSWLQKPEGDNAPG